MYLVTRTESFAKLFFIVSFSGLFMYIALAFYSLHTAFSVVSQSENFQERLKKYRSWESNLKRYEKDLKYILLWTLENEENPMGEGQNIFIDNDCPDLNCFVTTNKSILNGNYRNFDAIVFNQSIQIWAKKFLPKTRSPHQKYIFYGMYASNDHLICNTYLDDYFNWTWSYKLYSDIFSPFIEVKDLKGNVVAPRPDVFWADDNYSVVLEEYKQKLKKNLKKNLTQANQTDIKVDVDLVTIKRKALAWVVNTCQTRTNRMEFAQILKKALAEEKLVFDIYGCGLLECPGGDCLKMIERDYYFYLAFEESISEDYVTQEVLKAYHHDTVPIVVGGADYAKFLPDNSYIDTRYYSPTRLAGFIYYLINNQEIYHQYFEWKKFYTIHSVEDLRGICALCALLNNKERVETRSSYITFRKWWYYGALNERCIPKGAENYTDLFSYLNVNKKP